MADHAICRMCSNPKAPGYPCGYCENPGNLADPTTTIVTDGTPEAEASVMRERMAANAALDKDQGPEE